jgi:hypothetical protein
VKPASTAPATVSATTAAAIHADPLAEAKAKRAERFGIPLNTAEADKAAARAARFGLSPAATTASAPAAKKGRVCFAFQAGDCSTADCKYAHIAAETEEEKALAIEKITKVSKVNA